MRLGIDIGSKNIHYAIIDNNRVVGTGEFAHNGEVAIALSSLSGKLDADVGTRNIDTFGITARFDCSDRILVDPIVATVEAASFLQIEADKVLSIGCETFYLVMMDEQYNYIEHIGNSDCAAGTGSFIDQQAGRLGFSTGELSDHADDFAGLVPPISTRCAVFAKSDIIHAQAAGFGKDAIAAGICEGVARSIMEQVVKGRSFSTPMLITGGVSRNKKIVHELEKAMGIGVYTIPQSPFFTAIGCALLGEPGLFDVELLIKQIRTNRDVRNPLVLNKTHFPDFYSDRQALEDDVEITWYDSLDNDRYEVTMGMDIGSTSTKILIMTTDGSVLLGLYTRTKGDPVSAAELLIGTMNRLFGEKQLDIRGMVTTGSGRSLVGQVIGADAVLNEISAHARGAWFLDPEVDTIIEIGGQDSKFTLVQDGQVVHSNMNYVCAAGTGSFIEEQVARLDITLDQIEELALGSEAPFTSDRCTVYMERDLNLLQAEGWSKKQIMAAILYSVRDNYLSRVVGRTNLGKRIYFQGATGKNRALVAAFEQKLGRPILVSKFCHQTGSLGAAVYAQELHLEKSKFNMELTRFKRTQEICELCSNKCMLQVYDNGILKTAWGLKCGREYTEEKVGKGLKKPQLQKQFDSLFSFKSTKQDSVLTIGIPDTLYMSQYGILFARMFENLGCNVILSRSDDNTVSQGRTIVNADFCAPMNLAHGQVKQLLEQNVDLVFFPTIATEEPVVEVNGKGDGITEQNDCYYCYYSTYAPMIMQQLDTLEDTHKIVSPIFKWSRSGRIGAADDLAMDLQKVLPHSKDEIKTAYLTALADWDSGLQQWKNMGQKILSGGEPMKVLLLSRPYTLFDESINNNIIKHFENRGIPVIHQSMFDFGIYEKSKFPYYVKTMHWYYGQEILTATDICRIYPDVYPVFLTCFRCSPDAYAVTYFKDMMDKMEKPYAVLQLDEHGSDVGYLTRIEAAIESFKNHLNSGREIKNVDPEDIRYETRLTKNDILYIPQYIPFLTGMIQMAYRAYGYDLRVLPVSQEIINTGYHYTSGGECMPQAAILGSMVHTVQKENLDPKRIVFICSTACVSCNFFQFYRLAHLAFKKAGIEGIRFTMSDMSKGPSIKLPLSLQLDIAGMKVISAIFYKLYYRARAYEINRGDATAALNQSMQIFEDVLAKEWSIFRKAGQYIKALSFQTKLYATVEPDSRQEQKLIEQIMDFHPTDHLIEASRRVRDLFAAIPVKKVKKPRIVMIGDLYIKWNSLINDNIDDLVEELGGEVVLPSYTEYAAGLLHHEVKEGIVDKWVLNRLIRFEKSFEQVFEGLIDDMFEPPVEECDRMAREYGVSYFIPGETEIGIGKVLYMAKHGLADAFLNLNPVFCCPGVVSSSIFRKMQKDLGIPIIDIFYDGTNKPNKSIIPHMHYLKNEKSGELEG